MMYKPSKAAQKILDKQNEEFEEFSAGCFVTVLGIILMIDFMFFGSECIVFILKFLVGE